MSRIRIAVAMAPFALLTASCATAPTRTPLMLAPQTLSVVMATGMVLPAQIVDVTRVAVKANPDHAAMIAATAVASAPDQASAIRAAVLREAPDQAEAVVKAMKTALRRLPTRADLRVRNADDVLALVERATR